MASTLQNDIRGKVAIVGVGETAVGRVPGKTARELRIEAAKLALDDAGLTKDDVDGFITQVERPNPQRGIVPGAESTETESKAPFLADYLGIRPAFALSQPYGSMSGGSTIFYAVGAIVLGLANTVLITVGDNQLSKLGFRGYGKSILEGGYWAHEEFEVPYGPNINTMYAMHAQRHMYEYGTTSEQLAAVAVTFRKHAMRHPKAQMRTPITISDVLNSRMISSPLHLLDCSLVSDGAYAVVMTSAERARDLKQKPVYWLGGGECHKYMHLTWAPSMTTTGAVEAGEKAFKMAGVRREDIDVAYVYDPFTSNPIIVLEDLGFCEKGEGGPFVEGGRLDLGGELPTNTHGGLLSFAHQGRAGWASHLIELVLQLRGQADARQVKGAELALHHTGAGTQSCHAVSIWSNQQVYP